MKIIESTLSKASPMKLNVAPKYFQTNEMGGGFSHGCISGKSNEGAVRPCVAAVEGGGWWVLLFNYAYMRGTVADVSPSWTRPKQLPALFAAVSTNESLKCVPG